MRNIYYPPKGDPKVKLRQSDVLSTDFQLHQSALFTPQQSNRQREELGDIWDSPFYTTAARLMRAMVVTPAT